MKVYKIIWTDAEREYGYLYGEETLRVYGMIFKKIREVRMPRPTYRHAIPDLLEDIHFLMGHKAPQEMLSPLQELARKWVFAEEEKQDADKNNDQ
jgi:hypothetical protein